MMPDWLPLHFIRPMALWLLCALPLAAWWLQRRRSRVDAWDAHVDAHLRPHVLEGGGSAGRPVRWPLWLAAALAILALAGPAWRQVEQPAWQAGRALVVAVDLSSQANADDLPPSRLLRTRAKLHQLVEQRADGSLGLIAFADEAHVVAPVTDDRANVGLFVDALSPDIMPVDGQRPAHAIRMAMALLARGGTGQGDILILGDRADAQAIAAAREAAAAGYRVSAIAVGAHRAGSLRDREGRTRAVRFDPASLRELAQAGGGRMAVITSGPEDLHALGLLDAAIEPGEGGGKSSSRQGLAWEDAGYWLLLPVMLLALWGFRRSASGMMVVLLAVALASPQSARAQQAPASTDGGWWLRADQQHHRHMREGERAYRAGDYVRAAEAFAAVPGAEAQYNLGNALAKAGRYEDAIAAYDRALAIDPALPDASENREAVRRAMQRQQTPGAQPRQDSQRRQGQDQGRQSRPGGEGQAPQQEGEGGSAGDGDRDAARPPQAPPEAPPERPGQRDRAASSAADDAARQAAEQAQREAMSREMRAREGRGRPAAESEPQASQAQDREARERQQAVDAWLRRIPDTPGDWLRQKFWIEHQRRRAGEGD